MSPSRLLSILPLILPLTTALNPSCAPGGNFDLSPWTLQLPIADDNGSPQQIPASQLQGCDGYQDPGHHYFFTESGDGAMVMKANGDPGNPDCVTTPGSEHCRTEFRESSPAAWSTTASLNRLNASLLATTGASIVIGQVFQANSQYSKPIAELYYYSSGELSLGVEETAAGGSQAHTTVGSVERGTEFAYELRYENGGLAVEIDGGGVQSVETYFEAPQAYFKAGCYNQGSDAGDVHFFALNVVHGE